MATEGYWSSKAWNIAWAPGNYTIYESEVSYCDSDIKMLLSGP